MRPDAFAAYLRKIEVAPNGHKNAKKRRLRDKGVCFILETCRATYNFAVKRRHLPPYVGNPFLELPLDRLKIEDAKPIFVFTADTELAFFKAASDWAFPIHFTLAKTGLRIGELTHLLIEEVDLDDGWLHVRNKTELGWRIKTGQERSVPLLPEAMDVLWAVIGERRAGVVFRREGVAALACSSQMSRSQAEAWYRATLQAEAVGMLPIGKWEPRPIDRERLPSSCIRRWLSERRGRQQIDHAANGKAANRRAVENAAALLAEALPNAPDRLMAIHEADRLQFGFVDGEVFLAIEDDTDDLLPIARETAVNEIHSSAQDGYDVQQFRIGGAQESLRVLADFRCPRVFTEGVAVEGIQFQIEHDRVGRPFAEMPDGVAAEHNHVAGRILDLDPLCLVQSFLRHAIRR